MGKNNTFTPKTQVTFVKLGPSAQEVYGVGDYQLKSKVKDLALTLAVAPNTAKGPKSLRNVIATAEYKPHKSIKFSASHDFATKKDKVVLTWEGNLLQKPVTFKGTYGIQDKLAAGDAKFKISKKLETNVTFNQNKFLTAKHTLTFGKLSFEPTYNFVSKASSLIVSYKKNKAILKASYDLYSKQAALEWKLAPFKATLAAPIVAGAKPTLSLIHELDLTF